MSAIHAVHVNLAKQRYSRSEASIDSRENLRLHAMGEIYLCVPMHI